MGVTALDRSQITGVVLAGGRGRRMGGRDKGLLELAGRPLIEHVLQALAPQVGAMLISANRHRQTYARYGHPVVSDQLGGFQGPLAGIAAAMAVAPTPWILTLPCDTPTPHPQLATRLAAALWGAGTPALAVAHDGTRLQPVHALIPVGLSESLGAYLASGGRSINGWYARHPLAQADFSDRPACFRGINTYADWAAYGCGGERI
jgi:molybdenum cofactor guanylyltransferase